MGDTVNLRTARKQAERARAREEAGVNAAKHGQSKAARVLAATQDAKARAMLDAHRLDEQE
jgi:hypothetical protein